MFQHIRNAFWRGQDHPVCSDTGEPWPYMSVVDDHVDAFYELVLCEEEGEIRLYRLTEPLPSTLEAMQARLDSLEPMLTGAEAAVYFDAAHQRHFNYPLLTMEIFL